MDVKVEIENEEQPLLEGQPVAGKPKKTPAQKAIRKTFKGTAHLANLLPTGSVLAFQILSPVFTHKGECRSSVSQSMTSGLLALCAVSCFVLCFTDSFRDGRGKVRYGLATLRGFWVIDGSGAAIPPDEAAKYRLAFVDLVHALLSVLVFGAVALLDQNVVRCFYPEPSAEARALLSTVPLATGIVCSLLFVIFPTKRHGIGFPLSPH